MSVMVKAAANWGVCARMLLGGAVVVLLAGCHSDKDAAAAADSKFPVPATAQNKNPPDVNSVPRAAPTPKSTADERKKAVEGLVADRANAQHSDQAARSQPVVVRPLSDAPPPA